MNDRMRYYHVDVFSPAPFAGNGLIVFPEAGGLSIQAMQTLTGEMRQFESIFLQEISGNVVRARIFTCEEELDFAGHPVLGAAATLHDLLGLEGMSRLKGLSRSKDVSGSKGLSGSDELLGLKGLSVSDDLSGSKEKMDWIFRLNKKTVTVTTEKKEYGYDAVMNQGTAEFGRVLNADESAEILGCIGASVEDLYPRLWPTVVSTGLSYLVVPLRDNKFRARVGAPGLEEKLHALGTQFIGLLDIASRSIRTGHNDGSVEDIATGSLAGPSGAFLVAHGLEAAGTVIGLRQGENLGRNSRLYVQLVASQDGKMDVMVKGSVCKIASGVMEEGLLQ